MEAPLEPVFEPDEPEPDEPEPEEPEPDEPEPDEEPVPDAPEPAPLASPDPPSVELDAPAAFVRALLADDRSFFAQPDPLKWIAGVTSALRIEPSVPQLGQKRGPGSLIPWITSTRCVQLEQM